MKLLGAEEEDLTEGERHVVGDLREGEGRRIAAEKEIEDELLARGESSAADNFATLDPLHAARKKRIEPTRDA